jgi:hypothetical protein
MNHSEFAHPRLRKFVISGEIDLDDKKNCKSFLDHISNHYPLTPITNDSIDWTRVKNSTSVNMDGLSESSIDHFIQSTTLSRHSLTGAIYSREQYCYVMSLNFFITEFDLLVSIMPHIGFFVGISKKGKNYQYHYDDFLEWELDEGMFLSGKKILK